MKTLEKALQQMPGVREARVFLDQEQAAVSCDHQVHPAAAAAAVAAAVAVAVVAAGSRS